MQLTDAIIKTADANRKKALANAEPKPDLTLARRWQGVWDDPEQVPDFPDSRNPMSLKDALERRTRLRMSINGPGPTREPTAAEIQKVLDDGASSRRGMIERHMMVDGYIAKLEARAEAQKVDHAARTKELATRKVAAFTSQMAALGDELPALKEAAARHAQRMADAGAFNRLRLLKGDVTQQHNAVSHAAHTAGIPGPELPHWLDEVPDV